MAELGAVAAPTGAEVGEQLIDIFSRVPAEVLETMFFTEAAASPCTHDWFADAVAARVLFAGSHAGEMRLSVSLEAADSIASAFLGVEACELTPALRVQVVLELANILCGAVLSHLWPESKVALGAPEMLVQESVPAAALHRCFELPEGKIALWIDWSLPAA